MGIPKETTGKDFAEQIKTIKEQLKDLGVDSAEVAFDSTGILQKLTPVIKSLTIREKAIANVAQADPGNIQQVAASQLSIINSYYQSVLQQAQQSFRWALVAAGIGLLFFLAAIGFLVFQQSTSISNISIISGALIEVISAINFYLYSRASVQLASFHNRLDTTQRFLLANSVCENLEGEIKHITRASLVEIIANSLEKGRKTNNLSEKDE